MIPIVFCASLVPWPRLYPAADSSWRRRNTRSTVAGVARCTTWSAMIISDAPSTNPISGDSTMKIATLMSPAGTRTPTPPFAAPAPASPAMSACDELLGSPYRHVIQSHTNAARTPAKITRLSTTPGWTIPFPIVVATATPNPNAATKLKNAAHATAARGVSTRVDTTVAIEFAASWKPFMKSNASATRMRATTTASMARAERAAGSAVLERHAFDHVRDVLAAVDRVLEVVVDLLPLDDVDGIAALPEEPRHRAAEKLVADVLEPVDLGAVGEEARAVLQVAETPDRLAHLDDRLLEDVRELARVGLHHADVVEPDALRRRLDQVEDVVHARDQLVDVAAVDRGDERLV